MSPVRKPVRPVRALSPSVLAAPTADCFGHIHLPETELAIWERALPSRLRSWLDALPPECFPHTRLLLAPDEVPRALPAVLEEFGTPRGEGRDLLIGDVAMLVGLFGARVRTDLVDIRLEVVTGRACWKFHRDRVPVRMLTTYRGPTTQWVPPDRGDDAISRQDGYRGEIFSLAEGAVALFKGSAAADGRGIAHRSPPAEHARPRFLLCLNLPSAVSPPRWHA